MVMLQISTSLVVATAVSAPLMFTSATMVSIQMFSLENQVLLHTSVDVSIISLIFSVSIGYNKQANISRVLLILLVITSVHSFAECLLVYY